MITPTPHLKGSLRDAGEGGTNARTREEALMIGRFFHEHGGI